MNLCFQMDDPKHGQQTNNTSNILCLAVPLTMKPRIFISSVSREFRSARQLIANTLLALGCEPIWQDIFETSSDDLRPMLRKQIDSCSAVIQLWGIPTVPNHPKLTNRLAKFPIRSTKPFTRGHVAKSLRSVGH